MIFNASSDFEILLKCSEILQAVSVFAALNLYMCAVIYMWEDNKNFALLSVFTT